MGTELRILKEIAELLNEGTDLFEVLSEVLKKLLQVTGIETGWIFLIDQNGTFELAAMEKLPPALKIAGCMPMKNGTCWCLNKYNDGRLEKATNIMECKRLEDAVYNEWGETNNLTHHATVPLRAGNEKFGLLNVGSPNKTYFNEGELALLEAVAFQIGTAIKRIYLTQREQETALTAERNRLARDLHDSVNQLLFSLSLTARAGMKMSTDKQMRETFNDIQDMAQEALGEMRALIWQLRPRGLEKGLTSALKNYGRMLGLMVKANVNGVLTLPYKVEEGLWRIAQEAFNNCKKHSEQQLVKLTLIGEKGKVTMIISDDGKGFNYEETKPMMSLGLKSMKERVEQLNGSFQLKSELGKGTRMTVIIPVNEVKK
ncbi:GAF domain-containing sensor histidine kinase [Bacillus aquiflavi]|uniref:Oxygen sensor histidine kinase NreB n=1 Tax=Bacillus aquiflavi TaxID=2672567 RepID=A0A6B3VXB1_9BACI|nr:GAF domain-containing sensor histidine kinase [Bacillus aquiflavi]MBA4535608.1 GAF domain-containing sensor histidine kinase [Bacillus aquiflavi]NEY79984.1 GAF domain-containing sensor histidine kinase [Bacillus aquiflavi]UAC48925.1 GAF domain-containing sensor histidine kinase [Bacillus aquiflavi]